jgi:hypothetical protein
LCIIISRENIFVFSNNLRLARIATDADFTPVLALPALARDELPTFNMLRPNEMTPLFFFVALL